MAESAESLGDILGRALAEIDEAGGSSQHQLRQLIGAKVLDAMRAKQRTSAVIDRWANASPKTKAAATKALAVAIARHSDRPELLARIEREIGDTCDVDLPASSSPGA